MPEMQRRLPQYLKQHRRRAGYSQADVAYLLGARSRVKVSRYENDRHLPPLATALIFEAMFGRPISELFPSALAAARRSLRGRARRRMAVIAKKRETAGLARKKRSLEMLLT
jgi:transcriptional regulator with XRE-family HTH domain